jgi:hypothetical protein
LKYLFLLENIDYIFLWLTTLQEMATIRQDPKVCLGSFVTHPAGHLTVPGVLDNRAKFDFVPAHDGLSANISKHRTVRLARTLAGPRAYGSRFVALDRAIHPKHRTAPRLNRCRERALRSA